MFVKVTRSGSRQYVQLVESYRDETGRSKQRTLFTLGRLDQLGTELNSVISGLMRITGNTLPEPAPEPLSSTVNRKKPRFPIHEVNKINNL